MYVRKTCQNSYAKMKNSLVLFSALHACHVLLLGGVARNMIKACNTSIFTHRDKTKWEHILTQGQDQTKRMDMGGIECESIFSHTQGQDQVKRMDMGGLECESKFSHTQGQDQVKRMDVSGSRALRTYSHRGARQKRTYSHTVTRPREMWGSYNTTILPSRPSKEFRYRNRYRY